MLVAANHCFKLHSSINDANLERVVGRLRGHCQSFGQDFDSQEQVFRTLPGINPSSILHVFHDQINQTWQLALPGQRKGISGAADKNAEKATIYSLLASNVGANVEEFLELLGYRFDYGYRLVGICGVAFSKGFKVFVRIYQILDLSGRQIDRERNWTLEFSVQTDGRYGTNAIDAMLSLTNVLPPQVVFLASDAKNLATARDALLTFRQ